MTNWDAFVSEDSEFTCQVFDTIAQTSNVDPQQCAEMILLAFNSCGCTMIDGDDDNDGSSNPQTTSPPNNNDNSNEPQETYDCYTDLNEAYEDEATVDNVRDIRRELILCPNTIFDMGVQDLRDEKIFYDGFAAIRPRPNSHWKCGSTGSSHSKCVVRGGDIAILSVDNDDSLDKDANGVIFEGITFELSIRSSAVFSKRGDITFVDCIFRVSQCTIHLFFWWAVLVSIIRVSHSWALVFFLNMPSLLVFFLFHCNRINRTLERF